MKAVLALAAVSALPALVAAQQGAWAQCTSDQIKELTLSIQLT